MSSSWAASRRRFFSGQRPRAVEANASGGASLGGFTLSQAFDAALVDDHRVYHGVTPVSAKDGDRASHRDVLVVTYRRA